MFPKLFSTCSNGLGQYSTTLSGNVHELDGDVERHRLGAINIDTLPYGKPIDINGVSISLHPAGHVLGSAQNIKVARDAICDLIIGAPPGKVYNRMRTVAKRLHSRL